MSNTLDYYYNAIPIYGEYNEANEVTKYMGAYPRYYDKKGNITKDNATTYYYDRDNQLTKLQNGAASSDYGSYAYDALGRRIEFIDEANTVTRQFYHHGQRVIEEYDDSNNRQRYYVWGNYIDELLVMNDDAGDDSDYVVCHDHLYSATALLDMSDGSVVEHYQYDAYGWPYVYVNDGNDDTWFTSDDGFALSSSIGLVYLFTGRELDYHSGGRYLQYSRARYYDPHLHRRWLQRDPAGYIDGMNLYEYVRRSHFITSQKGLSVPKTAIFEVMKWALRNTKTYM